MKRGVKFIQMNEMDVKEPNRSAFPWLQLAT